MVAVPASKADLLKAIETSFDKLMADLLKVPSERTYESTLEGHAVGTFISASDLVAYLIGWNELVLKWLERDDTGEAVDFPETGFKWNQLGQLAQKFYTDYPDLDWPHRLERLTQVKGRLTQNITARSNEELYERTWYDKWPKGRMIQFNTSSPYANARGRIRAWLKKQA